MPKSLPKQNLSLVLVLFVQIPERAPFLTLQDLAMLYSSSRPCLLGPESSQPVLREPQNKLPSSKLCKWVLRVCEFKTCKKGFFVCVLSFLFHNGFTS